MTRNDIKEPATNLLIGLEEYLEGKECPESLTLLMDILREAIVEDELRIAGDLEDMYRQLMEKNEKIH